MVWKSLFLILLATAGYGALHSLLASLWIKELAQRLLGHPGQRFYRLVYNLVATVSLLPILALPGWLPDQPLYRVPYPWVLLNLALQGIALGALAIGVQQTGMWSFLGLQQLKQSSVAPSPRLTVGGLYRWVRHPLYTAGLAFIWFSPVMTNNLLALFIGFSIYVVIGALLEERRLSAEFGEAYRSYQFRTPFLIPGIRKVKV